MNKSSEFDMHVDGGAYVALPEAHRTTFVVGMVDMMEKMSVYIRPDIEQQTKAVRFCAHSLSGAELRQMLDDYMGADRSRDAYSAASNFICALVEKAGV